MCSGERRCFQVGFGDIKFNQIFIPTATMLAGWFRGWLATQTCEIEMVTEAKLMKFSKPLRD